MIYRATFLALLVVLLPGAIPGAAGTPSPSMEATNTTKYEIYGTAEKAGVTAFHLYLPSMKSQKTYDSGTYVLKGYAVINGLKVELPPLTLKLEGTSPIVLIISESGKTVTWATRAGTQSGNWY